MRQYFSNNWEHLNIRKTIEKYLNDYYWAHKSELENFKSHEEIFDKVINHFKQGNLHHFIYQDIDSTI